MTTQTAPRRSPSHLEPLPVRPGTVAGAPRAVVLKWWAPEHAAPIAQTLDRSETRITPSEIDVYLGDGELSVTIRGQRLDRCPASFGTVGSVVFDSSAQAHPAQHLANAPAWVQTAIAQAHTLAAAIHPAGRCLMNIGEATATNRVLEILTRQQVPVTLEDWQAIAEAGALLARQASKALGAGMSEDRFRTHFAEVLQPTDPCQCTEWTLNLDLPRVLTCQVCACTHDDACQLPEGPCSWVHEPGQPALCSGCAQADDEELALPQPKPGDAGQTHDQHPHRVSA